MVHVSHTEGPVTLGASSQIEKGINGDQISEKIKREIGFMRSRGRAQKFHRDSIVVHERTRGNQKIKIVCNAGMFVLEIYTDGRLNDTIGPFNNLSTATKECRKRIQEQEEQDSAHAKCV
jgi:hypothetical protein